MGASHLVDARQADGRASAAEDEHQEPGEGAGHGRGTPRSQLFTEGEARAEGDQYGPRAEGDHRGHG